MRRERARLIGNAIEAAGAPLSALVNCAAIFEHDTIDTLSEEPLQRHIALNALTPHCWRAIRRSVAGGCSAASS